MSDESDDKGPIPYERFAEVNRQLREAQARLTAIETAHKAEVSAIERRAAKLQADHEAATKRATELEGAVEAERLGVHIARAGVADPDLVDLVRAKYLATDPEKRPEFAEWYGEWAKEKPYLAPSTTTTAAPPPKQAPPTPPNKGAEKASPDVLQRVGALSAQEYEANRAAILKEMGYST